MSGGGLGWGGCALLGMGNAEPVPGATPVSDTVFFLPLSLISSSVAASSPESLMKGIEQLQGALCP